LESFLPTPQKSPAGTQPYTGAAWQIVGVQKAQISKLESGANSATIDTIYKVSKALKAEITFKVKLGNQYLSFS
jgi:plasmid maintenance system antidote protein VapI